MPTKPQTPPMPEYRRAYLPVVVVGWALPVARENICGIKLKSYRQCPPNPQTPPMPEYRRAYLPGGTFFLTIVTYQRTPLFCDPANVSRLRSAIAKTRTEKPFEITAAVVLPDHIHFLWTLPPGDTAYSQRIARLKILFTRSLRGTQPLTHNVSASRRKHRESDVWQRRFWEHTIRDEADMERHLDYIHYNPVKHGLASCPHLWEYSSFHRWVDRGRYTADWGCTCGGRQAQIPDFADMANSVGE